MFQSAGERLNIAVPLQLNRTEIISLPSLATCAPFFDRSFLQPAQYFFGLIMHRVDPDEPLPVELPGGERVSLPLLDRMD